jgi:hypothetical protein
VCLLRNSRWFILLENLATLLIRYRRRHVFTEAERPTGMVNSNTTSCETTARLLPRVPGRRFYIILCQGFWRVLYTWNRCASRYKMIQRCYTVLGAFAKLHTATISFFMSVCLSFCVSVCLSVCMSVCLSVSVRPHGTTRLPLDGFLWNLKF